jgi:hypothetical protein
MAACQKRPLPRHLSYWGPISLELATSHPTYGVPYQSVAFRLHFRAPYRSTVPKVQLWAYSLPLSVSFTSASRGRSWLSGLIGMLVIARLPGVKTLL